MEDFQSYSSFNHLSEDLMYAQFSQFAECVRKALTKGPPGPLSDTIPEY